MIALRRVAAIVCTLALCACAGGNTTPAAAGASSVQVRFIQGAPVLETIINGTPQTLSGGYLSVDGATLASQFPYGQMTQYASLSAGVHAVEVRSPDGYFVGPLKTAALQSGHTYTVIVFGKYPTYRAMAYEDPPAVKSASLAVYEASPGFPAADFGMFRAAQHNGFKRLGTVTLGNVAAISLGQRVSNFGAYAGKGTVALPGGALSIAQVNSFDTANVLPFNNATRFSLFVLDPSSSLGPVFGSLDQ